MAAPCRPSCAPIGRSSRIRPDPTIPNPPTKPTRQSRHFDGAKPAIIAPDQPLPQSAGPPCILSSSPGTPRQADVLDRLGPIAIRFSLKIFRFGIDGL